jgi:MoaA/NifB/PqqE/SkfB family radical SAM enzyme
MEEIISKVHQWAIGKKSPPSVIEFSFGDGCNQKCIFCNFPTDPKSSPDTLLTDSDYYRLIRESLDMGVDEIRLCGGGEPLYKKGRAMRIIELIKKNNTKCRLITNGTLFTENDIKALANLGIDDIQFSLMGSDSKTHDFLVGLPGAFDKLTSNISKFNYWKKRLKKNKPFLSIYFILTNKNYKSLLTFKKLIKDLGINSFHIYDLDIRSKECLDLILSNIQKKQAERDIKKLKLFFEKNRIDFYYQETIFNKNKNSKVLKTEPKKGNIILDLLKINKNKRNFSEVPCYEPWYYLAINGNGTVQVCPHLGKIDISIKNRSLQDLWYGIELTKIRSLILDKKIKGDCSFCCFIELTVPLRDALKKE